MEAGIFDYHKEEETLDAESFQGMCAFEPVLDNSLDHSSVTHKLARRHKSHLRKAFNRAAVRNVSIASQLSSASNI